jgi:drug/metabolite transporter (DMT)-like permease
MHKLLPHLGFVLAYIIWGINISSMKVGGREWDPLIFNGFRYLSILPIIWVYTYVYYRMTLKPSPQKPLKNFQIKGKDLASILFLGVLSSLGMEVLLAYSLQFSNPANGAVLGRGFMPIITAVIALFLKEVRLTWRVIVGLPLAFASVILIVAGDGMQFGADTLKGDGLLLLRSVFGAIYLIMMNRLVLKYPLPLLISLEFTAGAAVLLPYVLWQTEAAYLAAMSSVGWISLVYTALFATVIGFTVHNWSLGRLGPFKSSVYGYLLPITAAIGGLLILNETITWNQYIGGAGVLFAMYLVQRDRMQLIKNKVKSVSSSKA